MQLDDLSPGSVAGARYEGAASRSARDRAAARAGGSPARPARHRAGPAGRGGTRRSPAGWYAGLPGWPRGARAAHRQHPAGAPGRSRRRSGNAPTIRPEAYKPGPTPMKCSGPTRIRAGLLLLSDMGRVLASISSPTATMSMTSLAWAARPLPGDGRRLQPR